MPVVCLFLFTAAVLVACMERSAVAGEALKVELVPKAMKGQGLPELVVHAEAPLAKLTLTLKRSTDGKRLSMSAGPVHAGRSHRFELPMRKPGAAKFSGKLAVQLENGQSGEMPISVDVELVAPITVTIDREDVDLAARRLVLRADRDVEKVQVSLMSDSGTPLGTSVESWDGDAKPRGEPIAVKWKQSAGTVMRITVQAFDPHGFFGAIELFPWRVDIPHEEVNFATGSFEIVATEEPKLATSYEQIQGAIDRFGKLASIRLFVAGHTDTVGDAASNRTLSNNRARSLGRWFKKRGVQIPILYAGFGEHMLLVLTPDNTDQAKNRRAEYIVAVDPPPIGGGVRWQPL